MRRRANPGGKAAKAQRPKTLKRRNVPKAAGGRSPLAANKETSAARLARELKEAREQQTATADVLKQQLSLRLKPRSGGSHRKCNTALRSQSWSYSSIQWRISHSSRLSWCLAGFHGIFGSSPISSGTRHNSGKSCG